MPDGGIFAIAARENSLQSFQSTRPIMGGDCIGQLIQRALLGGQYHSLNIPKGNALLFANKQDQLLKFVAYQHHVSTQRIDQLARGVLLDLYILLGCALDYPADAITLIDAGQLNNAAVLAQSLADALVAIFVGHLHAAHVGGGTDVVSDKDQQRVRIRILAGSFNRIKLGLVRAPPIEQLYIADKEDLK